MSWIRLCVKFKKDPIRCILFHSVSNDTDTPSGFNDEIDYETKLEFYGSIIPQNGASKFCYSYKMGSDQNLYMDFYKTDTCPTANNHSIPEGGYGGAVYLYTSKPSDTRYLQEYKYYSATDSKTGIKRFMIMPHWRTAWNGGWKEEGTFWAYNYDKSDDGKFIICGRECKQMTESNPLFQLDHVYCKTTGSKALEGGNSVWNRANFTWGCDGALIRQEKVKGSPNYNGDGDDNYFYGSYGKNVDVGSTVDDYWTPKNGGFPDSETIPIINVFKNVSGGADDVYGLYKMISLNDKYMYCKRADKTHNILTTSNSIKYMKYSAKDLDDAAKIKYAPGSDECKNVFNEYTKQMWGRSGESSYNHCKNNELGGICEPAIRKYCVEESNVMQPICVETVKNLITNYPDRRPKLLKDIRNKYLEMNKSKPMEKNFISYCQADDSAIKSPVSNLDTEFKTSCDTIYTDFCKKNASSQNTEIKKICGCINGKTIKDLLIPNCYDSVCMESGYKTNNMITYTNCPKCVNIQLIKNVASDAQISNIKQEMRCEVEENTTYNNDESEDLPPDDQSSPGGDENGGEDQEQNDEQRDEENLKEEEKPDNTTNYILLGVFIVVLLIIVGLIVSSGGSGGSGRSRRRRRK